MESKLNRRDFFTLLLALLLGGGIAAFAQRRGADASVESPPETVSDSVRPVLSSPSAPSNATRQSPEAVACASAWESLKDGRLTRSDRRQVQLELLDEWSRHDLASALVAFCSEWDLSSYQDVSFFAALFLPAMDANQDLVEELLTSGRLGLETGLLRGEWLRHLGKTDPIRAFDRLDELPARERENTLKSVVGHLPSIREDPATWQAAMDRISALLAGPEGKQDAPSIESALVDWRSYEALNDAYLATADSRLRQLVVAAAEHAMAPDDPFAEDIDIPPETQNLPEPLRSAMLAKRKEVPAEEPLPPAE